MAIQKLWHKLPLIPICIHHLPRRKRHTIPSLSKNNKTPKHQLYRKIYTIKIRKRNFKRFRGCGITEIQNHNYIVGIIYNFTSKTLNQHTSKIIKCQNSKYPHELPHNPFEFHLNETRNYFYKSSDLLVQ